MDGSADRAEEEGKVQAEPGKSSTHGSDHIDRLPGGQSQETRNATKRVHEQDDKQTVKRLRAERDQLKAKAGEQSHVLASEKENNEQLKKTLEEKDKEIESLKADIKCQSERRSADTARYQKSIRYYERALKTSAEYAEFNEAQYNVESDRTKQLTRRIFNTQKVSNDILAEICAIKRPQEERNHYESCNTTTPPDKPAHLLV